MTGTASLLLLGLVSGLLLGAFFFAGLWWTIRRSLAARAPALWFAASLLLRTLVTSAGFYAVAQSDWRRLPTALLGFVLARLLVTRLTRALPAGVAPAAADAAP
jgi:F1F0 ATPase subunit 2